jgi:hypothetical protein
LASTEISVPGSNTWDSELAATVLTAVQVIGQRRQSRAASKVRKIGVA